jgi:ABC-2 type transport system ATP-binding protein
MLHNPPVLLLDEPTSAMDPLSAKQVRDAIVELQHDERTFLITTHNLTEAQMLADKIAIIRRGTIIAQGTFAELAQQFVGEPLLELRINGELNGLAKDLGQMVTVTDSGMNWLRYSTPDPNTMNPVLLRKLLDQGIEVVTVAPVTRTLEEIYLQVVKEDEVTEGEG